MEIDPDLVKCRECSSREIVNDEARGERVCANCGLVLQDDVLDLGAEWRTFTAEEGDLRARTGAPANMMLHDKGLATEIDWQNKDYSGKAVSSKQRSQYYRMRKWQRRARINKSRDRNLQQALSEIERIGSKLSLPRSAREHAGLIYRKCLDKNLIRGRSIDAMVAACLHVSNQKLKLARTIDDIARAARVGGKEISRAHRLIKRELRIRTDPVSPRDYVSRFCSELGLNTATETKTYELIHAAEERDLVDGKSPAGVAAAAIYIAGCLSQTRRTQHEIALISSVTEVTIRNRYKEMAVGLGYTVDDLQGRS